MRLKDYHLRIIAGLSINFSVAFFLLSLTATDPLTLTADAMIGIVCLVISGISEREIDKRRK